MAQQQRLETHADLVQQFTPTRTARCEVDVGHAGSALNAWI